MEICEEMQKLRDWLDENGINWEDNSEDFSRYMPSDLVSEYKMWTVRTQFKIKNDFISVINGYSTYGGYGIISEENQGLLEVMGLWNGIRGWMTCEEITEKITAKYFKTSEE